MADSNHIEKRFLQTLEGSSNYEQPADSNLFFLPFCNPVSNP